MAPLTALDALEVLQLRYEGTRIVRRLLVRRLMTLAVVVFVLEAWLHVVPRAAVIVVFGAGAILVGLALRAEWRAREQCRATEDDVTGFMAILPRSGSPPTAR